MQLNIYGILFVDCTKDATKSCDSLTNKTNIKQSYPIRINFTEVNVVPTY